MRLAHAHAHMRARGERDTTHTDTKAGRGQRAFNGTSGQYVYELFIKYCNSFFPRHLPPLGRVHGRVSAKR